MRSDARTRIQAAIIHDLASSMGSDQLLLAAMRLSLRAGGGVDLPHSERRLYQRIAASLEELRESRERDEAEQARGSVTWTMTPARPRPSSRPPASPPGTPARPTPTSPAAPAASRATSSSPTR